MLPKVEQLPPLGTLFLGFTTTFQHHLRAVQYLLVMARQLPAALGFLSTRRHTALARLFSFSVHSLDFLQATRAGKMEGGMWCTEESSHVHSSCPGDTLFLPCGPATRVVFV